jgi:hypothetical protein
MKKTRTQLRHEKDVRKIGRMGDRINQPEGAIRGAGFNVPPNAPKKKIRDKRKAFERMLAAVN